MKQLHLLLLTLLLCMTGLGLAYYKVTVIGLPLTASEQALVWNIEASISFRAKPDSAIKVTLPLPQAPVGFTVLNEDFMSANYGLAIEQDERGRVALWAKRRAQGKQLLFFRMALIDAKEGSAPGDNKSVSGARTLAAPAPAFPAVPEYPPKLLPVIEGLLDKARQQSADTVSFSQRVITELNAPAPSLEMKSLLKQITRSREFAKNIGWILAGARIPSQVIRGLHLEEGKEYSELESYLQVYDGAQWRILNIHNGQEGLPENFMVWQVNGDKNPTVEGAGEYSIKYSVGKTLREVIDIAEITSASKGRHLMDFSLHSLPVDSQNVYKVLLMVPLGALVVVLMRNLIGIRTFGTFMPVLIALAFRETELLWGLILFSLIIGIGLLLRAYVEQLKLLLVPRLASVLTMVVLLMAGTSVIMHKLGLEMGLSVALFPMVIMAMTIERMSLIWEEAGPVEAFKQVFGSLLVAVIGYLVMNIGELQYMFFVFPELLLIVLAIILLLGRYSGYRLTELWRFRALARR
ncbi:MAG: inactive transglutaminase family protein [Nitrosomonas sp.]|nr:inactive transglutaminase family protein [Nitrosomonas sp.]